MKTLQKCFLITAVLSVVGCKSIEGSHLGDLVKITNKNGESGQTVKTNTQSQASSLNECGEKQSSYSSSRHSADSRWCANLLLPGAEFSELITYEESINVPVDIAYIRAKRKLQFKDPDDKKSRIYNDNTQWDGIAGAYYGVKSMYGGPLKKMLWYSNYDLQLERIDNDNTKVLIKYKVYGIDIDPELFRTSLLDSLQSS